MTRLYQCEFVTEVVTDNCFQLAPVSCFPPLVYQKKFSITHSFKLSVDGNNGEYGIMLSVWDCTKEGCDKRVIEREKFQNEKVKRGCSMSACNSH